MRKNYEISFHKKCEANCNLPKSYDRMPDMQNILAIVPTYARLYAASIGGIKRRMGTQYEVQSIDCGISHAKIRKLLDFWHPRGCIVFGADGLGDVTSRSFGTIPVVYLDRTPLTARNALDVIQDYEEDGRIAAQELLDPEIDNYAFVEFHKPTSWSEQRKLAFERAIRLSGKAFHVFRNSRSEDNRSAHLERWLLGLPKPVGIFAANDRTAQEVQVICRHNGIQIPQDVTLLGIDNIPSICEAAMPYISSISSDFEMAGWMCADLLLERIANPRLRRAVRKYKPLGVIRRTSTRRPHGYNTQVLNAVKAIRARSCEGLTVDDVAAEMGCSRRMAEIRFRQATGQTIKAAITDIRLERAKVLLKSRELSLEHIAAACGYGSVTALRIAFRKRFDKTLTFFRFAGTSASKRR